MNLEKAAQWAGIIGVPIAIATLIFSGVPSSSPVGSRSPSFTLDAPSSKLKEIASSGPTVLCSNAITWHERALCAGDERLILLDRELEAVFREGLIARKGTSKVLYLQNQREWLKSLEGVCKRMATDLDCLKLAYEVRVKELRQ